MRRLATALACELKLHFRYGFHSAAILIGVASTLFLTAVPEARRAVLFPIVLILNQVILAFFLTARQVLMEKAEGSLIMIGVSPLRPHEYLASKVAAIGVLSLAVNLAMVRFAGGAGIRYLPLALGIAAASALLTLAAFLTASRFRSMGGFLLPSLAFVSALAPALLPDLLPGLEVSKSGWLDLHPLQAPLALIRAAFESASWVRLAYGVGYSALWAGVALVVCKKAFARIRLA